ncbi:MAG: hypothetical protein OEW05_06700 [Candidatus Aminicenantes bacterium]|nr:hypothetical protein [Candidatus Aminicenantes bacterium]
MNDGTNNRRDETPIRVDYDRIDVGDIMAQVRARIAARPVPPDEAQAAGPRPDRPASLPDFPAPDGGEGRSRAKRLLLKLMKPITPLIKLAILPVNEELVRTVRVLDHANRQLDSLTARVDRDIHRVESQLFERLGRLDTQLAITKENVKLLHALSHNLVVELTKLKIEHEALRNKVRILEKDFETLGKRERALEKRPRR